MPKRFTDTDLWDKEWFMSLSAKEKCLVRFIFDKCDAAGIWSPNWALASAYIGEKVSEKDLKKFENHLEFLGKKIFIKDFIKFQYGELSENCKPHVKIIATLKSYGLFERVSKGYTYPTERVQEKEEDKEEDKETVKEQEEEKEPRAKKTPKTTYEKFNSAYFSWFENMNGVKPQFNEVSGKALKTIIAYLVSLARDRGHTGDIADSEALKSWIYILENWNRIDPFIASQVDLKQISSNINRIITELKNGKKNGKQPTGGEVSTDNLAAKIAKLVKEDEYSGVKT